MKNKNNINNIIAKNSFFYLIRSLFWLKAITIAGKKRGRKIGFPTLNFQVLGLKSKLFIKILKFGVYTSEIKIYDRKYLGLLHYGPRLTFQEKKPVFEAYILGFKKKVLPGFKLWFKILKYWRKTEKFKNKQDLAKQIKIDIKANFPYN